MKVCANVQVHPQPRQAPAAPLLIGMARTVPQLSPLGTSTSLDTTTPQSAVMSAAMTNAPQAQSSPPSEAASAASDAAMSEAAGRLRFAYPPMRMDEVVASLDDDDVVIGDAHLAQEGSPGTPEGPHGPLQASPDAQAPRQGGELAKSSLQDQVGAIPIRSPSMATHGYVLFAKQSLHGVSLVIIRVVQGALERIC